MAYDARDAARAMGPLVLAHRDETEAERRIAQPIVERLIEERLCRIFLAEELAGHPASPVEALHAYEILAGFEASVPWLAWNNALVCGFSRFLGETARKELFSDPNWLYAQSTRPSGTAVAAGEGYRVSGRWSLVSGCQHAEWLLLHCAVEDGRMPQAAGPETLFAFVRRGDFEILDTWHVGGLRGTGSHDVVVREVLVPRERTLVPHSDPAAFGSPVERVPVIVHMVAAFAAQTLGVARSCVGVIVDAAKTKRTPGPTPDLRDRATAQHLVALHGAALRAARSHLYDCVGALWEQTVAGERRDAEDLAAVYAAALHADAAARTAVDDMYALGGTNSLYTDNRLERAHRDIHAMLRHVAAQPAILEDAGRVTFGLEPLNPQFAI